MKNLFIKFLMVSTVAVLACSQAFAFISVIDVTDELKQETATIQNASEFSLEKMEGTKLSYRGNGNEIVDLFSQIAEAAKPGYVEVEFEINDKTETISFTVKTQELAGMKYSYWVITKAGE